MVSHRCSGDTHDGFAGPHLAVEYARRGTLIEQ